MDTLNTFFNTNKGSSQWASQITGSQDFNKAKQIIAQELGSFQVPTSFYELLIINLCDALDIEIGNLLVWGWRKQREIIQYRNVNKPEAKPHQVTLLEHTLVSKHSPTIQPVINQVPLAKLKFDITLKLKLDGAILFIQNGEIFKITTGTCTGSGSIDYQGYTILQKKTAAYNLPGSISFEPGIPI